MRRPTGWQTSDWNPYRRVSLPQSQSKESARLSRIGQHYREHVVRNIKVGSTFNLLVRIKSHDILERSFIC